MAMADAAAPVEGPERGPRKASREARRQQLIEATIAEIAEQGYARTTLSGVARRAGLSHGLVNFHFQSKELLLAETLSFLSEEYRSAWTSALDRAGPRPAERLDAMIRADFNPALCATSRLSAWIAFWGEAQCRPLYQEYCGSNDAAHIRTMEAISGALAEEGGYDIRPDLAARVLRLTLDGIWMDLMTMAAPYALAEGLRTAFTCAGAFYPRHFNDGGLIGAG